MGLLPQDSSYPHNFRYWREKGELLLPTRKRTPKRNRRGPYMLFPFPHSLIRFAHLSMIRRWDEMKRSQECQLINSPGKKHQDWEWKCPYATHCPQNTASPQWLDSMLLYTYNTGVEINSFLWGTSVISKCSLPKTETWYIASCLCFCIPLSLFLSD